MGEASAPCGVPPANAGKSCVQGASGAMGEGEGYFSISSRAVGARPRMREPSSAFPPESAERFWESAERFRKSAERFRSFT